MFPFARSEFKTGVNEDVDTAAEQLETTSYVVKIGVTIVADSENAGDVFVGPAGVTTEATAATCGIKLQAGDSVTIEVDDVSNIWLIASVEDQKVHWVAV